MKTSKLFLLIFVFTLCSSAVFAQKQLTYVPRAVNGVKAIPRAVNPKLPLAAQARLSVPVVRPQSTVANVSSALERAVAAKVTVQERLARLEKNLSALEEYSKTHNNRLPDLGTESENLMNQVKEDISTLKVRHVYYHPLFNRFDQLVLADIQQFKKIQQNILHRQAPEHLASLEKNLSLLEEYIRTHNNKLPPYESYNASLLRKVEEDIWFLRRNNIEIALSWQRYSQLRKLGRLSQTEEQEFEKQLIKQFRAQEQAAQERALRQVRLQDRAWKVQPEDIVPDPAENAGKAAALGEKQIAFPGEVPTEDYINQLLRFYNELDPLGTGAIQ